MSIVDILIIIAIILFGINGYFKGFIKQLADFIILVIAFIISLKFYGQFSDYLGSQFAIANNFSKVVSFFIIWLVIQFVFNLIFPNSAAPP